MTEVQWTKKDGKLGAPGQLGMTADEYTFWNKSGKWLISVLDASHAFVPPTSPEGPAPQVGGAYYSESFPGQNTTTAFTTVLRWVGIQRMRTLYEQWSKKTTKPIKVCAAEFQITGGYWGPGGTWKYWCFDGTTVSEITKTGTQIKTTCPPGYTKIVHDDGSFGCIAPYVPNLTCVENCQQKYATDPQNFALCLAKCASTPPPPPIPPTQFTPRGYRQPVTTVAPSFPYAPPTLYRRVAGVEWLGRVPGTLGSLDAASTAQAKALLASWNATDGNNCINNYGLELGDQDPNTWGYHDGWVLSCFTNWWIKSAKTPTLPQPGTKEGAGWVDLDLQHLAALQQWGLSKGVINPGQIPTPPSPLTCAQNCTNKYGLDPQNLATCLAICASQSAPPPLPPPPTQPPLPVPPTPIPSPGPPAATTETKSTNVLPWVLGGVAALGLGALLLSGRKTLMENPPHPKSGYAYAYRGQKWQSVKDDSWDIVMLTPSNAKFMYVGKRYIDGSEVNVWKSGKRYVAQTTVMTGR